MVHTNVAGAAAAAASRPQRPPIRLRNTGSFHAGAPIPHLGSYGRHPPSRRGGIGASRRVSTHMYHTFPTPPPKTPSDQHTRNLSYERRDHNNHRSESASSDSNNDHDDNATPLPWKQLSLLALLSLCEQTALNSISPYLPSMVASFEEIPNEQVGLYVGLLASAFALAQLTTNLFWGYLSDTVGRKPVLLLGTLLLAGCFAFFGFCRTYSQLIAVHIAMGLLNGNAAVVPTCLGEVTDRSNQSRAFTWLPLMYSIGSISGPALGGLLIRKDVPYPFLLPNLGSAALLLVSVVVLAIWFDETLDSLDEVWGGGVPDWLRKVYQCACIRKQRRGRAESRTSRQSSSYHTEQGDWDVSNASSSGERQGLLSSPEHTAHASGPIEAATKAVDGKSTVREKSAFRQLANRTTLTVLITYLVFQLANISYNSLYPIFVSASPPAGRGLSPEIIGLSLSFAGFATIVFQVSVFQPLKAKVGNLGTYRASLLGIALSMAIMPFVGYLRDRPWLGLGTGKIWLYSELGVVLVIKNVCAVGGLSSVMLLITNSAPSHETLGTLNGIAQTLSAAGRSVGPFLSGALFTLSTHVEPKGEALAWGLFAGIALMGWIGTLFIDGSGLESGDWKGDEDVEDDSSEDSNSV